MEYHEVNSCARPTDFDTKHPNLEMVLIESYIFIQVNIFEMEDESADPQPPLLESKTNSVLNVHVLRDWKDYLTEAVLIIFSVFLGLFLSEWVNRMNEQTRTKELIASLITELKTNLEVAQKQYNYDTQVLATIDSALTSESIQKEILNNDEFDLTRFAPKGILHLTLSSVSWDVAMQHNISTRLNLKTISVLTNLYADQARIPKLEEEIAHVIFTRESRKMENIHTTLILVRDNYKGWAYDRLLGLMQQYRDAVSLLEKQVE